MKAAVRILFVLCALLWGLSLGAQTISVNYSSLPAEKVIRDLEEKSGYSFVYQKQLLEDVPPVTLTIKDAEIKTVLDRVLESMGLGYEVVHSTVVLKEAKKALGSFQARGTVKDTDGQPLPGVMVIVQGTTKGISTGPDGDFALDGVSDKDILVFSCIGLREQSVRARKTPIRITMENDVELLADVVVIGYGTARKTDLTGSVSNVKMADLASSPSLSVDNALQGRIAGADFLSTDGNPGSTMSIRIRGTRSITASNEPLIVVDGIMDAITDLNDLNPEEIESISVLKDASSTAIYGSRGANGVIIITTKAGSGERARPNITLKADVGFSRLPAKLDVMNAAEFALYRNDYAFFGTDSGNTSYGPGAPLSYASFPDPLSLGRGTDWFDEVMRTGVLQNYMLSVSGKTDKGSYYTNFSYNDTQGIIRGSGQSKFSGRIKVDRQFYKWLFAGYNGSFNRRHKDENKVTIGGTNTWGGVQYLSPHIDPVENYNPYYVGGTKINTPSALIGMNTWYSIHQSTNHNFTLRLTPVEGLTVNSTFSGYLYHWHVFRYYPGSLPKKTENEGGEAYRREFQRVNYSWETTASYVKERGGSSWNILGGFSTYKSSSDDFTLSGAGYTDDEVKWNNMNAVLDKNTYSASTAYTLITKMSAFARMDYNYRKRYYLTLTGRCDGASNFAENNKWAFFPSGAFRWNISEEPFMKNVNWVENLALRLSAGVSGNDAISAFRSLAALSTTTSGYIFDGSQPAATYTSRLASPDLTWEKTTLWNAAVDAELYHGRLNITAETYISRTTDLLLTMQVPTHTGYSTRYGNIGSTTNKGVELTLDTRNIVSRRFGWNTTLTMSHNSQMVEDIGTEDFVPLLKSSNGYMMYGYVAGYPLNSLWGFKYGGVWKSNEEIALNNYTHAYVSSGDKTLGKARYYDINYDSVLNQEDLIYQGNADPFLYGGLQNTFWLGSLKLGVYFAYSFGGKIYNYAELYMAGSFYTNQYRYMLDAWHPVRNPNSDIPRAGAVDSNMPSDFMIHDASYLRLKTVSLSYTIDLKKWNLPAKTLTVSAVGDNLWLWKRYNGMDPDVSSEGTSSTLRRLDLGAYPKPRSITFSFQLNF